MSALLPEGVTHLGDCPYSLQQAISFALRVLSYEEFPIEERPAKRIWLDGDALNEHWAKVERERKKKYSGKGEPDDDDTDYGPESENALELIKRG